MQLFQWPRKWFNNIGMNIKKGDTILVIAGKDKGKQGIIIKVLPKKNRIIAEGLNLYTKHTRPKRQGEKGEKILVPRSIDSSNVMFVCPNCKEPTRLGFQLTENIKSRYCKKCKAAI